MIKIVKLVSGDLIIGNLIDGDNDWSSPKIMENPATIVYQPAPDGKLSVGLFPFIPFLEDGKVTIPDSAIMIIANPAKELHSTYNTQFGSNLVLP